MIPPGAGRRDPLARGEAQAARLTVCYPCPPAFGTDRDAGAAPSR